MPSVSNIKAGNKLPEDINVIIEIPMNSGPIKYEYNKDTGIIEVDRCMNIAMSYPANYGFVPNTLSDDGDPLDVLVLTNHPIISGALINCKPIGVLFTEDEKGRDEKLLAVPSNKVDPYFEKVNSYKDLPEIYIQKIKHFFEHYKDLEKGKWVKVTGWGDQEAAKKVINEALK